MRASRYPVLRQGKKLQLLETFPQAGAGASFWKMVDADCKYPVSELALADAQKLKR